ncbi:MAG: alpha/beta fold hydrolase [Planctomycetes bacterium]|nr:alpha/beta fold hydrolase [Planctomycetota bacterium]
MGLTFVRGDARGSHYRIDGENGGRPIVLIHGATVPHWEFDGLVPLLVRAGFRCLRFDLLGHGESAPAPRRMPIDALVRQTSLLLDDVEWPRSTSILGHSLGAAITARCVALDPSRYTRVALVAPMLDFSARNPALRILRFPGIGSVFARAIAVPMLVRRRTRRYSAIDREDLVRRFGEQVRRRGFGGTLLRLERDGALGNQAAAYRELARHDKEICVLWGDCDAIIPRDDIRAVRDAIGCHEYFELPTLEHNLMLAHPERVAPYLVRWFGESRPPDPI